MYIIKDWSCSKCGHNRVDTYRNIDNTITSKCSKCGYQLKETKQ